MHVKLVNDLWLSWESVYYQALIIISTWFLRLLHCLIASLQHCNWCETSVCAYRFTYTPWTTITAILNITVGQYYIKYYMDSHDGQRSSFTCTFIVHNLLSCKGPTSGYTTCPESHREEDERWKALLKSTSHNKMYDITQNRSVNALHRQTCTIFLFYTKQVYRKQTKTAKTTKRKQQT